MAAGHLLFTPVLTMNLLRNGINLTAAQKSTRPPDSHLDPTTANGQLWKDCVDVQF